MEPEVGDRIVVAGSAVGRRERRGTVVAVLGPAGVGSCIVRWQDGHESIVVPGPDARLEPPPRTGRPPVGGARTGR